MDFLRGFAKICQGFTNVITFSKLHHRSPKFYNWHWFSSWALRPAWLDVTWVLILSIELNRIKLVEVLSDLFFWLIIWRRLETDQKLVDLNVMEAKMYQPCEHCLDADAVPLDNRRIDVRMDNDDTGDYYSRCVRQSKFKENTNISAN